MHAFNAPRSTRSSCAVVTLAWIRMGNGTREIMTRRFRSGKSETSAICARARARDYENESRCNRTFFRVFAVCERNIRACEMARKNASENITRLDSEDGRTCSVLVKRKTVQLPVEFTGRKSDGVEVDTNARYSNVSEETFFFLHKRRSALRCDKSALSKRDRIFLYKTTLREYATRSRNCALEKRTFDAVGERVANHKEVITNRRGTGGNLGQRAKFTRSLRDIIRAMERARHVCV